MLLSVAATALLQGIIVLEVARGTLGFRQQHSLSIPNAGAQRPEYTIAGIIPTSLGAHMAPVYALIATPAIVFLPQDAFYFGIASVLSGVMAQFGITPMQAAVASMVGQSFRLISPVIPALYLLCGETNQNFVEFQKKYTVHFWPVLVAYMVAYGLTGALPY